MIRPQMLPLLITVLAILAFAMWRGGAPERYGVGVIIAMAALQLSIRAFIPNYWTIVDVGPFLADILGFLGFGLIAMRSRRIWPMVATALQMVCLGSHFARWASVEVLPQVYAVARGAPTILTVIMLAGATVLHILAVRRGQVNPGWQDWSNIPPPRSD